MAGFWLDDDEGSSDGIVELRELFLYINPLFGVPSHIPAWAVAEVGKQGLNTNFILRWRKLILSLAVLFVDCIHSCDAD
jgi:hypothetical protein